MRILLLYSLIGSLAFAAAPPAAAEDYFSGTWKYDPNRSKTGFTEPGMAVEDETMVIQVNGDLMSVTIKGVTENKTPISIRYVVSFSGGPINYAEGEPPEGTTVATRKIGNREIDFLTSQNGKVVSNIHATVNPEGNVMRFIGKGLDEKGRHFHSMTVFYKPE